MGAEEAAAALGVKRATLYTYVSRGWLQRRASGQGRRNLYLRADVERLCQRRDARAGHAAAAAGALRWGEPVIHSRVSELAEGRIRYRGLALEQLAERGGFEEVAELLWTGALPEAAPPAEEAAPPAAPLPEPAGPPSPHELIAATLAARSADEAPLLAGPARSLRRARALVATLHGGGGRAAAAICRRLGDGRPEAVVAVDRALILSAEHGLNASTFAARVAASTGADLYSAVIAALAAFSGPRHGGACDHLEAVFADIDEPAEAWVEARTRAGQAVPGFVHRLYPRGDPRGGLLLAEALALGPIGLLEDLAEVMARAGWRSPTLDYGLLALCRALGWPPGSATWIFAVGRSAGWIAHALEQRASGQLLRPRAAFAGD